MQRPHGGGTLGRHCHGNLNFTATLVLSDDDSKCQTRRQLESRDRTETCPPVRQGRQAQESSLSLPAMMNLKSSLGDTGTPESH